MKYNLISLSFPAEKSYMASYKFKPVILESKSHHGNWILSTVDSDTSIRYITFTDTSYDDLIGGSVVSPFISQVIEISEDKYNEILQKELIIRSLRA